MEGHCERRRDLATTSSMPPELILNVCLEKLFVDDVEITMLEQRNISDNKGVAEWSCGCLRLNVPTEICNCDWWSHFSVRHYDFSVVDNRPAWIVFCTGMKAS